MTLAEPFTPVFLFEKLRDEPLVIAERVLNRIFRFLYSHSDAPGPLPLRQWEALAVRSAELTLEYVVIGSLAAMLYVAIRSRQEKAPA